jgi:hypothetical protein
MILKRSKALNNLQIIKKFDNYETPPDLFKKICKLTGIKPKLDASGSKRLHKCPRYISKNALQKELKLDFWLNPPYSKVAEFIEWAYRWHKKNNLNGLVLVYSKTDTKWFHKFVYHRSTLIFIEGRIKFWKNGRLVRWCKKCQSDRITEKKKCWKCKTTLTINSAPFPSMVIVYRKRKKKRS